MCAFALFAKAQYQFPNSDFEGAFVNAYTSKGYTEPVGWHGYATISGTIGNTGRSGTKLTASDDVHEGTAGSQSVCVTATSILTIIANGVMTNGQIYSGSMSAADGAGNYNFSDQSNTGDTDTYGDNDQFFTPFTGRPDCMRVWLKFVPAAEGQGNARASVYLHKDGTVMYDPTDNVKDTSIVVAHAEAAIPAGEWTQYTLPFDYDGEGKYDGTAVPGLILATFSTNETPGKGTKNDSLYIDDIEMVYLSTLAFATYDGEEVAFAEGAASIDAQYDADKLACAAEGVAATIETDEPTADNGYTLTITVRGDNISEDETNYNTYTIQFAAPEEEGEEEPAEPEVRIVKYTDELVVTIDEETTEPMEAEVIVEYTADGGIDLALNNFILVSEGVPMYVGNIEVPGIELNEATDGAEYRTFHYEGITTVGAGDLEGIDPSMWIGWLLGDVPLVMDGKLTDDKLYLTIDIDMRESIGQVIYVVFGSDFAEAGGEVAISSVRAESVEGSVHDLSGRAVAGKPRGGIYIVNGKKVVLR